MKWRDAYGYIKSLNPNIQPIITSFNQSPLFIYFPSLPQAFDWGPPTHHSRKKLSKRIKLQLDVQTHASVLLHHH